MRPGITDEVVLDLANQAGALLLTADKDFGELIFRQRHVSSGVMLIRLAGLTPQQKAEVVVTAVNRYAEELLNGFSVVTSKAVRIRRRENK
jgi:predicted nuclease of predicted toxin-antitoxin system